jgi:hypothetical protein
MPKKSFPQAIIRMDFTDIQVAKKTSKVAIKIDGCRELINWLESTINSGLGNYFLYACITNADGQLRKYIITSYSDRMPFTLNLTELDEYLAFPDTVQINSMNPCANDLYHCLKTRISKSGEEILNLDINLNINQKQNNSTETNFFLAVLMEAGKKSERVRGEFEHCVYNMAKTEPPFLSGFDFIKMLEKNYKNTHENLLTNSPAAFNIQLIDWSEDSDENIFIVVDFSQNNQAFVTLPIHEFKMYQQSENIKAMSLSSMKRIIEGLSTEQKSRFIRIQYEENGYPHYIYLGLYNSKVVLPPLHNAVVTTINTKLNL